MKMIMSALLATILVVIALLYVTDDGQRPIGEDHKKPDVKPRVVEIPEWPEYIDRLPRDPHKLYGRRYAIAAGKTDLPDEKVQAYRKRWALAGYHLPEWKGQVNVPPSPCPPQLLGDTMSVFHQPIDTWTETYEDCPCCAGPPTLIPCDDFWNQIQELDYDYPDTLYVSLSGGCLGEMTWQWERLWPGPYDIRWGPSPGPWTGISKPNWCPSHVGGVGAGGGWGMVNDCSIFFPSGTLLQQSTTNCWISFGLLIIPDNFNGEDWPVDYKIAVQQALLNPPVYFEWPAVITGNLSGCSPQIIDCIGECELCIRNEIEFDPPCYDPESMEPVPCRAYSCPTEYKLIITE